MEHSVFAYPGDTFKIGYGKVDFLQSRAELLDEFVVCRSLYYVMMCFLLQDTWGRALPCPECGNQGLGLESWSLTSIGDFKDSLDRSWAYQYVLHE